MLTERFERLVALAPEVSSPSRSDILKSLDHSSLRAALSPTSSGRVSQLEAPSKKGLADYDRHMSSTESSVKKAMKSCSDHVNKVRLENEREMARQAHLEKLREKQALQLQKQLAKAQAEGQDIASKEAATTGQIADDDDDDDENHDDQDQDVWDLVKDADAILSRPCTESLRNIPSL